jgi:hypothetical protein
MQKPDPDRARLHLAFYDDPTFRAPRTHNRADFEPFKIEHQIPKLFGVPERAQLAGLAAVLQSVFWGLGLHPQHARPASPPKLHGVHQHPHAAAGVGAAAVVRKARRERSPRPDAADLGAREPLRPLRTRHGRTAAHQLIPDGPWSRPSCSVPSEDQGRAQGLTRLRSNLSRSRARQDVGPYHHAVSVDRSKGCSICSPVAGGGRC